MSKGTILVIDDEKDLLELVRYNLEKDGFDVICAPTADAAWRSPRSTGRT